MRFARLPVIARCHSYGALAIAGLAATGLLLVLARGVIDHVALYDELLHVLAARGLLETGRPIIADGIYPRGLLFTNAVAWSFALVGESLVAARLPALLAGGLLAFLTAVLAGRRAGLLAGTFAALLLVAVPDTVEAAVFARFYTLHALILGLVYAGLFEAMWPARSARSRIVIAVATLCLLPLAWHLQETTLIAAGAGAMGVIALIVLDRWSVVSTTAARYPFATLAAVLAGAVGAFAAVWYSGLWAQLTSSPLWAADRAGRPWYYLGAFGRSMPLLWPLLPLAAVVALAEPTQRRLAVYCVAVVASALIVHSAAGAKALRYVYYLMPLVCVLWALPLSALALRATAGTTTGGRQVTGAGGLAPGATLVLLAIAFALSQEGSRLLNLIADRLPPERALSYGREADWAAVARDLQPRAQRANHIVTSNAMKALYYLGDYDYELNASIVAETETLAEFGRDARTGRHAIGTADSVADVLARPGTSLVVLEEEKIGKSTGVSSEALATIERRCEAITLPKDPGLRVWSCVGGP
jgi:hypothetical protein